VHPRAAPEARVVGSVEGGPRTSRLAALGAGGGAPGVASTGVYLAGTSIYPASIRWPSPVADVRQFLRLPVRSCSKDPLLKEALLGPSGGRSLSGVPWLRCEAIGRHGGTSGAMEAVASQFRCIRLRLRGHERMVRAHCRPFAYSISFFQCPGLWSGPAEKQFQYTFQCRRCEAAPIACRRRRRSRSLTRRVWTSGLRLRPGPAYCSPGQGERLLRLSAGSPQFKRPQRGAHCVGSRQVPALAHERKEYARPLWSACQVNTYPG
jgi:hypothetical protein